MFAYTNNMDYSEYLLYFVESGICVQAKQSAYMPSPIKIPEHQLLNGLPWARILQIYCCIFNAKERNQCM